MSKSKVVSLARARLARLTPEERAERRADLRRWRNATRTNEIFLAEHNAAMSAAVLQKIEDHVIADVIASFRDLARTTVAEATAGVRARLETLKNHDVLAAAVQRAIDSLYGERPELFTYPQMAVRPWPR